MKKFKIFGLAFYMVLIGAFYVVAADKTVHKFGTIVSGAFNVTLTAEDADSTITLDNVLLEFEASNATQRTWKFTSAKAGNITVTLEEDFTLSDGYALTMLVEDAAGSITLDNAILEIENTDGTQRTFKFTSSKAGNTTITLNENFTVSDGTDVTLTSAGQANTLTLNESLTLGDGSSGTLTFSQASKTLTVEVDSKIDQNLSSGQAVTFANVTSLGAATAPAIGFSAGSGIDSLGSNLRFYDPTSGVKTLAQLIAGTSASETVAGVLEIATDIEAVAVTATNKAIVPSNLDDVFSAPPALGDGTPNTGAFSTLSTTGLASPNSVSTGVATASAVGFIAGAGISYSGSNLSFYDTVYGGTRTLSQLTSPSLLTGTLNAADNIIQKAVLKDYGETVYALGSLTGATDADLENGNVQTFTVGGAFTLSLTNPPASGTAGSITFIITNGSSSVLTWDTDIDWAGGTAPSLTASGVDVVTCVTIDAGTIWSCFAAGLDVK